MVKNPPAHAGDLRDAGSIPGLGRSPGGGHGSPFQFSCLENPMDKRSLVGYSAQSHRESDTTEVTEHTHTHTHTHTHVLGRTHAVHARTCVRNLSGCTQSTCLVNQKRRPHHHHSKKYDSGLKAIKNFKTPIYRGQLSPYTHSALRPTHIGIGSFGGFGKLMEVMQTLSRKSTDRPTHAQVVVQFQGVTDLDHEPQMLKL